MIKTNVAIVLFLLGFILALLTFPMAWGVSILLGYISNILAIFIGSYLIARCEHKKIPLVLGCILLGITVFSLIETTTVHIGVWTTKELLKESLEGGNIMANLEEPFRAGDWEITVLNVVEGKYIKVDDSYYKAKESNKIIITTIRFKNISQKTKTTDDIWNFNLISNTNKSYERGFTFDLEAIWSWNLTSEIEEKAISIKELDPFTSVAPGAYITCDIFFQIPKDEKPAQLYFQIGVIKSYDIRVKLY